MHLFVSGTDTGVGKTVVTAALARQVASRGRRVCAWKPIETGCLQADRSIVALDDQLLQQAGSVGAAALYRLKAPLAPRVAAELEGVAISIDAVAREFQQLQQRCDATLVEGAGGLRVPITDQCDMLELARTLGLPVLLVGRAGLGTLNHVALSVEALRREQMPIAGVVLSRLPDVSVETAGRNQRELERMLRCRVHVFEDTPSSALMLAEAVGLLRHELS